MQATDWGDMLRIIDTIDDETDLTRCWEALRDRQRTLRKRAGTAVLAQLSVGSRVRLVDEIRPRHFAGREGVVEKLASGRSNRVHVKLDGDTIPTRVPPTCVTVLS